MRLNKKVWLVVGIVILAGALAFLFSTYSRTAAEHNALQDRLSSAQTRLPSLIAQKDDLQNQLSQATSALATSRAKFPAAVASIEYDEGLCETAVASKVQISRITASPPGDKKVGTITYSVSSFVVVVTGEVKDILDFVHALRTGRDFEPPWSAEVKQVDINYQSRQALIGLDIFGYKG